MLSPTVIDKIRRSTGFTILSNEPMKRHTSFKIGGSATVILSESNKISDLRELLCITSHFGVPVQIIGNGTNILVSDAGVEGLVIKIKDRVDHLNIYNNRIVVGSGCTLSKVCRIVAIKGLSGLEFAVGIPGTIGGAIVMNAGAHDSEIGDLIEKVTVMDFSGKISILERDNLEFSYRLSNLQNKKLIVLEAELELKTGDSKEIKARMLQYLKWRRDRQPLNIPNAGSIFKNPDNYYAGKLIDEAGCKGMQVGGAEVSSLNANFIINNCQATARDVLTLIKEIQKKVNDEYGIWLTPEIRLIS